MAWNIDEFLLIYEFLSMTDSCSYHIFKESRWLFKPWELWTNLYCLQAYICFENGTVLWLIFIGSYLLILSYIHWVFRNLILIFANIIREYQNLRELRRSFAEYTCILNQKVKRNSSQYRKKVPTTNENRSRYMRDNILSLIVCRSDQHINLMGLSNLIKSIPLKTKTF